MGSALLNTKVALIHCQRIPRTNRIFSVTCTWGALLAFIAVHHVNFLDAVSKLCSPGIDLISICLSA